jgi:hypothetical protein
MINSIVVDVLLKGIISEIKENNYDVNILWKGNIACLWVLENDFVLTIAGNSDIS